MNFWKIVDQEGKLLTVRAGESAEDAIQIAFDLDEVQPGCIATPVADTAAALMEACENDPYILMDALGLDDDGDGHTFPDGSRCELAVSYNVVNIPPQS